MNLYDHDNLRVYVCHYKGFDLWIDRMGYYKILKDGILATVLWVTKEVVAKRVIDTWAERVNKDFEILKQQQDEVTSI